MSIDTRIKWLIIAFTAASTFALVNLLGLSFPPRDLVEPFAVLGGLGLFAAYYHRRGNETFLTIITALMQMVAYTMCFTTLMYAVCALGRPQVDGPLMAWDLAGGVHLPSIMSWMSQHPWLQRGLAMAYATVMPQTALVIAVLGFTDQRRDLQGFLRQFMISSWIMLVLFAVWPAAGPFVGFGFEPAPDQARYLEHFDTLRSGARTLVTWRNAEGLITFPSFHTTWALLLAYALRRRRVWFVPSVLLNAAVIVSTMTTGWHYFADVLSGAGIAVVAVAVSYALEAWFARAVFAERALATNTCESLPQPISIPLWRPKLVRSDS